MTIDNTNYKEVTGYKEIKNNEQFKLIVDTTKEFFGKESIRMAIFEDKTLLIDIMGIVTILKLDDKEGIFSLSFNVDSPPVFVADVIKLLEDLNTNYYVDECLIGYDEEGNKIYESDFPDECFTCREESETTKEGTPDGATIH